MWASFLPKSILGIWSVTLAVIGILFNAVCMVLLALGDLRTDRVPL